MGANPYFNINSIGLPTSTKNVGSALTNIISLLLALVGMLAILFILIGAIQFAYSRGNPKNTQTARETILYACVGLILAVAAYAIVAFVTRNIK